MQSSLIKAAIKSSVHAPYFDKVSKHCALETDIGTIASGPIQICSYPNSVCAVRSAVVTAIARGATKISRVAIHEPSSYGICNCCVEFLSLFVEGDCIIEIFQKESSTSDITSSKNLALNALITKAFRSQFLTKEWMKRDWFKELNIQIPMTTDLPATFRPLDYTESNVTPDQLCGLAVRACRKCYVPISSFPVGAAALFVNKHDELMIATAGNVERDTGLHLGLCAEQSCICAASSMGGIREIKMLAVCTPKATGFGKPCGMCRQSLVEFGDYPILMCVVDVENHTINHQKTTTMELLPDAFTPATLV